MIGLNKLKTFCIVAVAGIIGIDGLRVDLHHRNQPNGSKLAMYS